MQNNLGYEYEIPEPFHYEPFYFKENRHFYHIHNPKLDDILKRDPFYYDMLSLINREINEVPWKKSELSVPVAIEHFKQIQPHLQAEFSTRRKNSINEKEFIYCLSLFIVSLFWTNEVPVKSLYVENMELSNLKFKPVNCKERLSFVLNKPSQYHSFIQLKQMFEEQEKIFYKARAMKELNKKRDYSK